MVYKNLSPENLKELKAKLENEYNDFKASGLKLDMSRGKPASDQLDACMGMLDVLNKNSSCRDENGTDLRNYGILDGTQKAKQLFADILGTNAENVIVGGNSSLNLMYDTISRAYTHGLYGSAKPWSKEEKIKFLCPAPGYDRHFAITEFFGFELVLIPMTAEGPDMDEVEKYVSDPTVKGIWCVPKFSNPDGITYSDETVRRMAALKPSAPDFRIFWDNAYCVHYVYEDEKLLNIFDECKKHGSEDMVYMFASTSKVTFPGAGISCMVCSKNNVADIQKKMFFQTIGADKLNMLRHTEYFDTAQKLYGHMDIMASFLKPKFDIVLNMLEKEIAPLGIANWKKPNGGYFVSFFAPKGTATEIIRLCAEAGVKLTPTGSTYPYKKDIDDSNIRLAPSYPTTDELKKACEVFCVAVKLATVNSLL